MTSSPPPRSQGEESGETSTASGPGCTKISEPPGGGPTGGAWPGAAGTTSDWPGAAGTNAGCGGGGAQAEVAARFAVSDRWIRKLLRLREETGGLEPRPRGGGQRPAFDAAGEERLRAAVAAKPDATLAELAAAVGIGSVGSVHRT